MAKEDKIFNNRYNTGEINYEPFPKMRIDLPENFDILEEYQAHELQKVLLEIFQAAPFFETLTNNRKVPKGESCKIFYHFEDELNKRAEMRLMDKFIIVADFMEMSYEVLYKEISIKHKETLLKEMDDEYGIFKKRNIHRLF
jgi:hypothetical protein